MAPRRRALGLAGQHPRQLDHPLGVVEGRGRRGGAAVGLDLADRDLVVGERGDLRQVGDDEDLAAGTQVREGAANGEGGLAWAAIYATVGLVAFAAWLELFLRSPWAAVAVLAIVAAVVVVIVLSRRRRADPPLPRSDGPDARTR